MTTTSVRWDGPIPALDRPVMVVHLTGWIDAGGAAKAAIDAIIDESDARTVAVFDDDTYLDFRARRPTMQLVEGLNSVLDWQHIDVSIGADRTGRDLIIVHGPEPDLAWHRFAEDLTALARATGTASAVHLGAYPFAAPHTRAPRLSVTTASQDVLASVPFLRSTLDVPAGIAGVLEHSFHEAGIPTLGIWAQVPHYAATMEYPSAAIALLDGLRTAVHVVLDAVDLRSDAIARRRHLDELVAANEEHLAMLRQLEELYDSEANTSAVEATDGIEVIPADELGAEVERFLREQE